MRVFRILSCDSVQVRFAALGGFRLTFFLRLFPGFSCGLLSFPLCLLFLLVGQVLLILFDKLFIAAGKGVGSELLQRPVSGPLGSQDVYKEEDSYGSDEQTEIEQLLGSLRNGEYDIGADKEQRKASPPLDQIFLGSQIVLQDVDPVGAGLLIGHF